MMIKEDIQLYKTDFTGVDPFNKITREYASRDSTKGEMIAIPRHAPFYIKSVKLFTIAGEPLEVDKDYEFYGILGKLTAYTAMPVGLFIKIVNPELKEWYFEYQTVGNFNKITNEILNLLQSAYKDDRKVKWENITNRPTWFIPTLHQHDLTYDIYGFTDLATQLLRIAELRANADRPETVFLEALKGRIATYISGFREVIKGIVDSHDEGKVNDHGVWKDYIGLDKVDDFPVATVQEAIDGLSTELHLTPYVAAQAVAGAAGKNSKLFPAGSLPILRYGTDTFIPPTISGSYEGMGGYGQRSGAIVESDGTLLILNRRNNGKTAGLYFTRSFNYMNKNPDYEFTAYRYTHPTAEAAGVELTDIINGSNRHMMIVGNSKKNIWYWAATNGTFDPSRHVLNRITGDWVNFLGKYPEESFLDKPFADCTLLANEDFMTRAVILQAYNPDMMVEIRPNWKTGKNPRGTPRHYDGFGFYQMVNGSSKFLASKVNFQHPKWGNANDFAFTPYIWETVDVPGWGFQGVKSYHAEFETPLDSIWTFRSLHASTGKINTDITAFRMEFMILTISGEGNRKDWRQVYRASLVYGMQGSTPTVQVVPSQGSDVLYKVNANDLESTATPDGANFNKFCRVTATPETQDLVGSADLGNGFGVFVGGSANWSYPNTFSISGQSYFKGANMINVPPPNGVGEEWRTYQYINKTMYEQNPVGLGALFTSQVHLCMDTDDYTTGAIMARQVGPNGTEWIVRPSNFLGSNWIHSPASNNMTIAGKSVKHYPLTSKAYKTNIGPQMVICQPIIPSWAAGFANNRYKRLFGADAWSNITGKAIKNSDEFGNVYNGGKANGDGLFIKENKIKLVNDVVTFTPVAVYNLKPAIATTVKNLLTPLGFSQEWIDATWTVGRLVNTSGKFYETFTVWQIINRRVKVAYFTCDITPKGNAVTKDGYQYWADCNINKVSDVQVFDTASVTVMDTWQGPCYISGTHTHTPIIISVPHNNLNVTVPNGEDKTAMNVFLKSMTRFIDVENRKCIAPLIKLGPEGLLLNTPLQSDVYSTENGPDTGWISTPLYGLGKGVLGVDMMEGAGIIANSFVRTGDVFANCSMQSYDPNEMIMGINNLLVSQYIVYFNKIDNVIMAGKSYSIESTFIDIKTVDPSPANKTYYVYVYYANARATYEITQTVHPESPVRSMIAIVKCGPTQIDTIEAFNRFSMDGAIVSARRQGGSILTASGSVFEIGDTSKILLDGDFIP